MFGFGKKREGSNRKALREEFETVTATLRSADNLVQVAVGHSINMASSFFTRHIPVLANSIGSRIRKESLT